MRKIKVAIFASGTGSNALALIKKSKELRGIEISFVLSDKRGAPVLEKSQAEGIKTYLVERDRNRHAQELEVLGLLKSHEVDWVFLAGYMRLISKEFLEQYSEWHNGAIQVVNIHPSLLPAYPGTQAIEIAYADGANIFGVTLHLVDEGVDTGSILNQESIVPEKGEALSDLKTRIHRLEHKIYTDFLQSLTQERRTHFFSENK